MSEGAGLVVREQPGIDPASADGRALFAAFFGDDVQASDLELFPHSIAAGSATQAHVHTAAVAACVTRGRITVGTGEAFAERVDLGPGDYFFIPAELPHEEQVIGDEPVEFLVAHLERFHTLEI